MAARSVHIAFKNLTDETLVRVDEGLSHGIYTEPWFPPATIAPDAVGEWQTESDGFLTGTEGSAKYRLSNGNFDEFVTVTWDNPYVGANGSSISIIEDFSGEKSKVFDGANMIGKNVPPNLEKMLDIDIEAWVDAILFPPYIFANASSANDANAAFAIRRKRVSSPLFGSPSDAPKSSRLNTALKAGEWVGLWSGDGVSVALTSLGKHDMSAHILDTTPDGQLQLQEDFTLGAKKWAAAALVTGLHIELGGAKTSVVNAVTHAVIHAVAGSVHGGNASAVNTSIRDALNLHDSKLSDARLATISNSVSAALAIPRTTVLLSHGIALTLYDTFVGDHKSGGTLLYERVGMVGGPRLASHWLNFYPILH